jgi:CMP-N-acetylneuraminic acid synthetase
MEDKILGIIPARGGSKGFPHKNIRPLCGKLLIFYTIEEAIKSKYLTKVILSTEERKIAEIAKDIVEIIPRPKELAENDSLVIDAAKYTLEYLRERGEVFSYVVLLQPTSPLRKVEDIDSAIEKMLSLGADSVVEVGSKHPARMKRVINERIVDIFDRRLDFTPRQELPKVYLRNGAIYDAKVEVTYKKSTFRRR